MVIWNLALEGRISAYKGATELAEAKRLKKALDEALAEEAKEVTATTEKEAKQIKKARQDEVKKAKKAYWCYIREAGGLPTYEDQCKYLTQLRREHSKHEEWSSAAQRSALHRVHNAYESFIRRLKEGKKKAGFPRHKSENRVRSFETESFSINRSGKLHAVSVKGVGKFRFKGELPDLAREQYKKLRIVKTARRIWVMVVCELSDVNIADSPLI